MPLYEFQCSSCGIRFERILRFVDPLPEACPECGGKPEKLLSSPAIQFKGSGWYITDYARKGGAGEPAKAAGESTATTTSSESKPAESKPSTAAASSKTD